MCGMRVVSVHVYMWRPNERAIILEGELLIQCCSYKVDWILIDEDLSFMAESSRRILEGADTQSRIGLRDGRYGLY